MSVLAVLLGLAVAIFLIIKNYNPVYSMFFGALIGGLLGGHSLSSTIIMMIDGIKDMIPGIARIISAGVLVGILVKTGATVKISETIIEKLGSQNAILAITFSVFLLCSIGIFINVAIFTVAPIALLISKRLKLSKFSLLVAMSGGGKAGNIISPNPVVIAGAEGFGAPMSSVMGANIIPAVIGVAVTIFIANYIKHKGECVTSDIEYHEHSQLPSFFQSIVGPLVTIFLLTLKPIANIDIDPMIALPIGGFTGLIAMNKMKKLKLSLDYGLERMSIVAILLIGTGALVGIIKSSGLKDMVVVILNNLHIGNQFLASISGMLMSGVTASSTAGTIVTASTFSQTILDSGISAVWAAALAISGSTVLDHMPHGSLFHNSASALDISLHDRMRVLPHETLIGIILAMTTIATMYFFN